MIHQSSQKVRGVIGRLLREGGNSGCLTLKIIMDLIDQGLDLSFAFVLRRLIDSTITDAPETFVSRALLLAALIVLQIPAAAAARYSGGRYMALAMRGMRIRSGRKMTELPLAYLNTHHSGDLLSRVTNDLGQLTQFLETRFTQIIKTLVSGVACLVVMLCWSWEVTLVTFFSVPVFMALTAWAGRPIEGLTSAQNEELGHVSAAIQDAVGGAAEIKTYGLYDKIAKVHDEAVDIAVQRGVDIARANARVEFANLLTVLVPVTLICAVGVWMVLIDRITMGTLLAIILISNDVRMPMQMWHEFVSWWRSAAGAARRIFELWDEPAERSDGEDLAIDGDAPLVSFRNVRFSYRQTDADGETAERTVFRDLSVDIRRGERVAVVGSSGIGKSTFIHLIAGFYEPDGGTVFFGGHETGRWNPEAMRRHMALVQQDTYLFPGTLRENIACGAGGSAQEADIVRAASQACIHDFIVGLPRGYDTSAGERGVRLSGGQRQRVAIARALLKDAPLLLLDEPTSSLDMKTEQEIQHEFRDLMRGRTSVIIAHRLSTVRDADRILVLNEGRIVEEGSHDRLMTLGGVYAELVARQALLEGGDADDAP